MQRNIPRFALYMCVAQKKNATSKVKTNQLQ